PIALLLSWGAASGALPCVSHVGTAERSVSGSNDIQGAEHVPALLGPKIKRLASAQVPNRSTGKSDWHEGGPRPAARDSRPRRRSPSWPRERDPRLRQRGEACPAVAPEEVPSAPRRGSRSSLERKPSPAEASCRVNDGLSVSELAVVAEPRGSRVGRTRPTKQTRESRPAAL